MNAIEIQNLKKSFGNDNVLDGLTFQVKQGSVFGFLGKNGAGKTTTMKIILGLLEADSGDVKVLGEPVRYGQTNTNRFMGYLPDVPSFYDFMNAKEYLALCGQVGALTENLDITSLLGEVGLDGVNKRIGSYSRGMKQRLGIAAALLNQPKILICDEPTSALDPTGRKEILDVLKHLRHQMTIVFSTHILSDVERICDTMAILNAGQIRLEGELNTIKKEYQKDGFKVGFSDAETCQKFSNIDLIKPCVVASTSYDLTLSIMAEDLYAVIAKHKLFPRGVEPLEPTLESVFLEVIK